MRSLASLPRVVMQIVNGFLSLKELGVSSRASRDHYVTAASLRCVLNSESGGMRTRWVAIGREFSWPRLKCLLRSPLRLHVSIVEATDGVGGMIYR